VRDPAAKRTAVADEPGTTIRKDDDFASLRGDARFEEIVGATPG
jgi:hypothetical protein